MVVVLPWHDPVRVAEQIALVDIMLGEDREFIIGFGRGLARYEFERFRIPMDTSRERFREAFEIIRLGLTENSFSYDGKFFQIPETVIRPAPRSKNLMDKVYISSVTPPSIETAAQLGAGLMISSPEAVGRPHRRPEVLQPHPRRSRHEAQEPGGGRVHVLRRDRGRGGRGLQ